MAQGRIFTAFGVTVLLGLTPGALRGQTPFVEFGAHGLFLYTHADPVAGNRALGEVRLVQPAIMMHAAAFANRLRFRGTLDLEGLTIRNGELTPGVWGEGFLDRRHPHTYAHELMLMGEQLVGRRVRVSVSLGKGFAPFGTEDPMSRPIIRYPVNHHLAQILERAVVIAGLRAGPVILEGGLFNGDEPAKAGDWPNLSRFGDSWSGRLTLLAFHELELQGSYARVHSPEHRPGAGTDQRKWSAAARWDGKLGGSPLYGLVEWVRTSEAEGFLILHGVLVEGAWSPGRSRLHYRFEHAERPEEERTLDPFRSVRPHFENSILGITRWTIHTVGYGFQVGRSGASLGATPFVELSYGRMKRSGAGIFDPATFYGKESFVSLSAGVRVNLGMPLHRMGRYGVVQNTTFPAPKGHNVPHEH